MTSTIHGRRSSTASRLEGPSDDFYPIDMYRRLFGSASVAENRKRKHRKIAVNGVRVVALPGESGDQPWKPRRQLVTSTEKDSVYENSSDSDQVEEGQAETKFKQLKAAGYGSAVRGMSLAALLASVAGEASTSGGGNSADVDPVIDGVVHTMPPPPPSASVKPTCVGAIVFSDSNEDKPAGRVKRGSGRANGKAKAAAKSSGAATKQSTFHPRPAPPMPTTASDAGAGAAPGDALNADGDDDAARGTKNKVGGKPKSLDEVFVCPRPNDHTTPTHTPRLQHTITSRTHSRRDRPRHHVWRPSATCRTIRSIIRGVAMPTTTWFYHIACHCYTRQPASYRNTDTRA